MSDPFDELAPLQPPPKVASLAEYRERPRRPSGRHKAGQERRSRFFSAADLDGKPVPERQWLVPDLIPSSTVTLLSGDGGTGKSLIALQLAAAVAQARPWLGRSTASGRAVFMSAEDDEAELHRRLVDVARAAESPLADLDQLTLRSLAGEDALLAALDARTGILRPTPLLDELDAFLSAAEPALLVLDTLADLFPGDENTRAQARQFIGLLRGLAIRHRCAVVLLSHPSLAGMQSGAGTSGSTAWSNSVRSRLYLRRVLQGEEEPNPDARVLSVKKSNYAPSGAEIALSWRDGVFVSEASDSRLDRMALRNKAERVFLKLLRMFADQDRTVNSKSGPNYAPSVFSGHPDCEGMTRDNLRDAMERLFTAGRIRNAEVLRDRKPTTVIQEVV